MRLFTAIRLTPQIRSALANIQEQMRSQRVKGNYVSPDSLHLTLAFIGEYPEPDDIPLPPVRKPFEIALEGFGAFGDLWWAGLRPSAELQCCAADLRHSLSLASIPFDRKRFSPHITLVRRAAGHPVVQVPDIRMMVDHVSLMRSDRGKSGMVYTEVRRSEIL